ncbi:MAG: hypothetical protein AB1558_14265 [Thermodesulfobacteriota bacterium]
MKDFWSGKTPCWQLLGCTPPVYSRCSAFRNRERPCWETAESQCRKILSFDWECRDCKVFKIYGQRD